MALWKDNTAPRPAPAPPPAPAASLTSAPVPTSTPAAEGREAARAETPFKPEVPTGFTAAPAARAGTSAPGKESLITADITIEGKIEGGGSVRIAGKFKGDVNVQGDLTIEAGAKLTGSVRADKVTIAGELEGNVDSASRIDLLKSGVVMGDLKARSLAVEAGATMRGRAEFGGEDGEGPKGVRHTPGNGAESGTRS